jgi:hypothetical protein
MLSLYFRDNNFRTEFNWICEWMRGRSQFAATHKKQIVVTDP